MSEYQEVGGGETVKKNKKLITITANAVERIKYLLDQKKHTNLEKPEEAIGIRVLIKQKGCSGLKYDIEYAYDTRPLESIIEETCSDDQKVKVLIDPKSVMFILGSEMDYVEEKFSSGFVFKNPMKKESVVVERVFMSSSYFALFKIEPTFNISFDELEKKYIELSKTDINEKKSKNMENINKAYQVLKSPLERAEHLLNLFNVKNQKDHLNSEILNESMEVREYLLDCDDLQFASRMVDEKIKGCIKNLINTFAVKNFDGAATQVLRLKYLYKSFEEVKKNATNSNF